MPIIWKLDNFLFYLEDLSDVIHGKIHEHHNNPHHTALPKSTELIMQ